MMKVRLCYSSKDSNEWWGGNLSSIMHDNGGRKTFRIRLEAMTTELREKILSGELGVGQFLPSEMDLGRQYNISNKTVRRGLDVLVGEGLLEKIPKIGNRVIDPGNKQATVVRFGYFRNANLEADLTAILEEFHRRHPHIRVQTVEIESTGVTPKHGLEGGFFDLVTLNGFHISEFVHAGKIGLLEEQERRDDQYPFLDSVFMHEGKLYAQPFIFSPVILCYNKNHFAEEGLPEPNSGWTWNDFGKAAQRLSRRNKRFGHYQYILSRTRYPLFLMQSGASFHQERGRRQVDRQKLGLALQTIWDLLYTPDVFPLMLAASNADAEELFASGKVSMIVSTYLGLNELKGKDIVYDIAPVPTLGQFCTQLVTISIGLNRRSKVKPAANQLMQYLLSEEVQLRIRQRTLSLPANRYAAEWNEDMTGKPSRYFLFREIIPSFRTIQDLGLESLELMEFQKLFKLYCSGLLTLQEVADQWELALNGPNVK